MHQKLKEIIEQKQREVALLKKEGIPDPDHDVIPVRDFKGAISLPERINLISEIKFASPSAGRIREDSNPADIGLVYENAGAAAISFLTDEKFFQGNIRNLPAVKEAVSIPILRKDFIINEIQVREALIYGADAILLIARILSTEQLKDLLALCKEYNLSSLTEIHDREDLDKSLKCGADIIGINNRDLDTFDVDISTTSQLAELVPESCILVSESGISNKEDIDGLKGNNINAVLVGSALMSCENPGEKIKELVEAGKNV